MPALKAEVLIFDPMLPTKLITVHGPGLDTWFRHALIRRDLRDKLKTVERAGEAVVPLSGGMGMLAEAVEIGVVVGTVRIARLTAHVVDEGDYGIQFGSDVLEYVFSVGSTGASEVRVSSAAKDDPEALAVEVYAINPPFQVVQLESFLLGPRTLHNIALLANNAIEMPPSARITDLLLQDKGIPEEFRLRLTWIDTGSIWLTLKSGCKAALEYSAKFFETGATAKLAHQVASAKEAENAAAIHEATRAATIERVVAEEERLKAENIVKSHQAWRENVLKEIDYRDELISKINNSEEQAQLRAERDKAIRRLLDQQALPIVRNLPRKYEPPEGGALLLPERFDDNE